MSFCVPIYYIFASSPNICIRNYKLIFSLVQFQQGRKLAFPERVGVQVGGEKGPSVCVRVRGGGGLREQSDTE